MSAVIASTVDRFGNTSAPRDLVVTGETHLFIAEKRHLLALVNHRQALLIKNGQYS